LNGHTGQDEFKDTTPDVGALINSCFAAGGIRTHVHIKSGSFDSSTTIGINLGQQSLTGAGQGTTHIEFDGAGAIIEVGNGTALTQDFLISHLRIHGDSSANQIGIHYGRGRNLHIYDVYQKKCDTGFLWDTAFCDTGGDDCIDLYANNVILEENAGYGLILDNSDATYSIGRGNWSGGYIFGNAESGIYAEEVTDSFNFHDVIDVSDNKKHGVHFKNGSFPISNVRLKSNSITNDNTYSGVLYENTEAASFYIRLFNVIFTGATHKYAVDITSTTAFDGELCWIGGELHTSHGKINLTDFSAVKSYINIRTGWKNEDMGYIAAQDGDTLTYDMDEDAYGVSLEVGAAGIIACLRSGTPYGGSFTIDMKNISDGTTVAADQNLFWHVRGLTSITN